MQISVTRSFTTEIYKFKHTSVNKAWEKTLYNHSSLAIIRKILILDAIALGENAKFMLNLKFFMSLNVVLVC